MKGRQLSFMYLKAKRSSQTVQKQLDDFVAFLVANGATVREITPEQLKKDLAAAKGASFDPFDRKR